MSHDHTAIEITPDFESRRRSTRSEDNSSTSYYRSLSSDDITPKVHFDIKHRSKSLDLTSHQADPIVRRIQSLLSKVNNNPQKSSNSETTIAKSVKKNDHISNILKEW